MSNFDVCTLQTRLLEHKLCTMFKTVHNLISFPPILVPRHSRIGYNAYLKPFAHTNSFLYSFVPSTISLWNSLPSNVTSTPTLAIAVVSIALEHKLFIEKKTTSMNSWSAVVMTYIWHMGTRNESSRNMWVEVFYKESP